MVCHFVGFSVCPSSLKWEMGRFSAIFMVLLVQGAAIAMALESRQPLSRVAIHRTIVRLDSSVSLRATPEILGTKGEKVEIVTVTFKRPSGAASTDWIGVFSPAKFNSSLCLEDLLVPNREYEPYLCTAPIKFQYANFSSRDYISNGNGELKFRLINQRSDFSFGFFAGDIHNPVLLAVSNSITFADLKAPAYPRLAQGQQWNEITVTWTSGYGLDEATPFVTWGPSGQDYTSVVPASTTSPSRHDMCGPPASTVGWRDPGQIHTSTMKDLWPNARYNYQIGHRLHNGSVVLGEVNSFKSPPFPGEDSLQRVVIFGDMGKQERDGSNVYNDFQPGSLNTTDQLKADVDTMDIIFHIGDLSYANGYISQWDQFTEQIESLSARMPYMTASGNHERDWPNSGSFYNSTDSGGECGVLSGTVFNMPVKSKDKFWYSTDYGLFHFCIADSEQDWREGTEQYQFIEQCLASVDRQKQPWLIFIAHRVLGYSSWYYGYEGTTAEPMSRENLQKLWQKYKVDIAFFGHVHNYERSCPAYNASCVSEEAGEYSGRFNATIHVVVGGGGAGLTEFPSYELKWSLKRDYDFGFTKMTAFNRSTLLFEYKRSRDGQVHDQFWLHRDYKDVLGCDALNNCPQVTLAM